MSPHSSLVLIGRYTTTCLDHMSPHTSLLLTSVLIALYDYKSADTSRVLPSYTELVIHLSSYPYICLLIRLYMCVLIRDIKQPVALVKDE